MNIILRASHRIVPTNLCGSGHLLAAALYGLLWFFSAHAVADSQGLDCAKVVFKRYCLGGAATTLPADAILSHHSSGQPQYRLQQGEQTLIFAVQDGIITAIERQQPQGNWLNFKDWTAKLVRVYGQGEDLGKFPAYAASRSSRLHAINTGKGFAKMRWRQNGWQVVVLWQHRDYIVLRYALNSEQGSRENSVEDEGL